MIKNRLLEIRLERGYKFQKDMAEFLEMSKKDYNLIENNKKSTSLENASVFVKQIVIFLNLKLKNFNINYII